MKRINLTAVITWFVMLSISLTLFISLIKQL